MSESGSSWKGPRLRCSHGSWLWKHKHYVSQGWTVSAIARHLGVTRVTVRRYLSGEQTPGVRASSAPDPFAEYVEYCRLRLAADPHLWATTLFDEVTALGYQRVVSVVHPGDP